MDRREKSASRPTHLSSYARACLQALAQRGLGYKLSVGGGLGLLHYLDYRRTHDVDAWWDSDVTPSEQEAIVQVIKSTLQAWGEVDVRAWGEVISVELSQAGEQLFSFQIADRSAQLESSRRAPWVDVNLDSLSDMIGDIIASKMVALVERGAPRDFRDMHAVCHAGLVTPSDCWSLWACRQRLSDSDTDWSRARLAVATHLKRIALHRPLDQIPDRSQRSRAAEVRGWYREVFLNALPTT